MFEKVSQIAEQAATNVSRRQFLGRFGKGAMTSAAAAGGLLAVPTTARAGRNVRMCSTESAAVECQGKPYGSACWNSGPGRCVGPKTEEPGVYNCNLCKRKGSPKPPR